MGGLNIEIYSTLFDFCFLTTFHFAFSAFAFRHFLVLRGLLPSTILLRLVGFWFPVFRIVSWPPFSSILICLAVFSFPTFSFGSWDSTFPHFWCVVVLCLPTFCFASLLLISGVSIWFVTFCFQVFWFASWPSPFRHFHLILDLLLYGFLWWTTAFCFTPRDLLLSGIFFASWVCFRSCSAS